jgi:glycosyltransferase involved in cell wall biosynthesis
LYYKSKLNSIIIPNAIEISPILSCSLPNPETGLNIAFFGRLVPQKRPDIAVLEFKKYLDLQESNINSKLIFIGGGFLETDLKKLLLNSNNFIFKGYLEHNLAISELSRCQVYLNTSDYEGFCIARIEALSLGLCVISRKNAGYLQLISLFSGEAEMREYGIFFIEDSESIGEILSEIMHYKYWTRDKILRRKQLAQYFSPLNTVSNYLSL